MVRFLHSSDLHLGKRFGHLPEDLRGRLREARHQALARLAQAAREGGAGAILLAGDTFDTETPAPALLRQALAEIGAHADLTWVLLPGNHDSLLADQLWAALRAGKPDNLVLATSPEPVSLGDDAVLLPAPCPVRRPGRDLTEWMDRAHTPEGTIRVGLAHGAIQSFSEEDRGHDVIAPDRAARAGLGYLALGDWHGQMRVDARTWYSGTPEPERFKHDRPGAALVVDIAGPDATPEVSPLETGRFAWTTRELEFFGDTDAAERLVQALPPRDTRRDTLLRVVLAGRLGIAARTELESVIAQVAPEFGHLETREDGLVSLVETTDLDAIERGGALRQAAEALKAQGEDPALAEGERKTARDALARLFSFAATAEAS